MGLFAKKAERQSPPTPVRPPGLDSSFSKDDTPDTPTQSRPYPTGHGTFDASTIINANDSSHSAVNSNHFPVDSDSLLHAYNESSKDLEASIRLAANLETALSSNDPNAQYSNRASKNIFMSASASIPHTFQVIPPSPEKGAISAVTPAIPTSCSRTPCDGADETMGDGTRVPSLDSETELSNLIEQSLLFERLLDIQLPTDLPPDKKEDWVLTKEMKQSASTRFTNSLSAKPESCSETTATESKDAAVASDYTKALPRFGSSVSFDPPDVKNNKAIPGVLFLETPPSTLRRSRSEGRSRYREFTPLTPNSSIFFSPASDTPTPFPSGRGRIFSFPKLVLNKFNKTKG